MKAVASVALLATLATACTLPRGARTAAVASGAILSITGATVMASNPIGVDSNGNGYNDNPFNDNYDNVDDRLAGLALLGLGVALLVGGATAKEPAPAATMVAPLDAAMPPGYVPGVPPGKTLPAPPAPPRASLPEVATDDVALRMAQQARAAVARGECDAAWSTWAAIDARDPRYAAALASGPVLAPCPRPLAHHE